MICSVGFPLDAYELDDVIPRQEIIKVAETSPEIYVEGGVTICRVHRDMVLKYGHGVRLSEAQNMRFVSEHTTIRLRAVFDAWEQASDDPSEERNVGYIMMSYVEGVTLSEIWSVIDSEDQTDILKQVQGYISQLHLISLETPRPIGGDISRCGLFTDHGAGPFNTVDDLEAWFNERLLVCQQFGRSQGKTPFSGRLRPLVMCHLDIALRNLIMDSEGIIWLLD